MRASSSPTRTPRLPQFSRHTRSHFVVQYGGTSSIPHGKSPEKSEHTGSSTQQIPQPKMDCRKDNAEALLILFNIAHTKFSEIPLRVSTSLFYQVAILCDQYDCAEMVSPWLSGWIKNEDQDCCGKEYAKWMLISWVFGRTRSLQKSASCILRDLKIDDNGELSLAGHQGLPRMLPHGALSMCILLVVQSLERISLILIRTNCRSP